MEATLPAESVPEYKPAPVPKLLSLPLPEMTMCPPKKKPNLEYHPEKPALNASPAKKRFDEAASAPKYVPSAVANGAEDEWVESEKEEEPEEQQQQEQQEEQVKAELETELDELAKTTIDIKPEPQEASEETPKNDNEKKTSSSSSSARRESRKHEHKSRDSKERRSSSQKEKERSSGEHRSSSSSSKHKSSSSSSSSHRKSSSSDKHRSEKKSSSKDRNSSSKTATASTTSASSSSKSRHHSSSSSKSTSRSSSSSKSKSSSSNSNSHSTSNSNSRSSSSKSTTKAEIDTSTSIELPAKPDDDIALDYEMSVDVSEAEIVRQCEMIFDELEQAFAQKPEETSTENVRKRKAPSPDIEAYTEAATAALQKRRVAHENADKCKPQAPVAVHKPNHIRNAMQAIFDRRAELRRQEKLRAEADAELLRQAQERVRIAQEELREARAKTLTPLISRSSLTPPTRIGDLRLLSTYLCSMSLI